MSATAAGVGGVLLGIAPATGPAAPFVAGAGVIAQIPSLLGFGPDPRKVPDTQKLEAMQLEINKTWNRIAGDSCPVSCNPGDCGRVGQLVFSCPTSAWDRARAPASLAAVDEAEAYVMSLFQWARENMLRKDSLRNPNLTDEAVRRWQSNFSLLRDALRKQLPPVKSASASVESQLGLPAGTALPLGVLAVGVLAAIILFKVL